jgi:secondary thiamine-phosphate synthase enzyme
MVIQKIFTITAGDRGAIEITAKIQKFVGDSGMGEGLCHLFIQHTSASLIICENADPDVLRDLEYFMARLVVDGDPGFLHTAEGPDDMPAHIRSILTQSSLTLPVRQNRCALGTWQGIFLWEHRTQPHSRKIMLTLIN